MNRPKLFAIAISFAASAATVCAQDLTQLQDVAAAPDFKSRSLGGAEYGGAYIYVDGAASSACHSSFGGCQPSYVPGYCIVNPVIGSCGCPDGFLSQLAARG